MLYRLNDANLLNTDHIVTAVISKDPDTGEWQLVVTLTLKPLFVFTGTSRKECLAKLDALEKAGRQRSV